MHKRKVIPRDHRLKIAKLITTLFLCMIMKLCILLPIVKLLSRVRLFATPWTVAYQDSLSMGFSRQEYWSGLPFPSPGDLPDPGIEPRSPTLEADTLTSEPERATTKGTRIQKEQGTGCRLPLLTVAQWQVPALNTQLPSISHTRCHFCCSHWNELQALSCIFASLVP